MIKATCHCGAVRFAVAEPPTWVMDCNCTVCRRYGAMWCYTSGDEPVTLVEAPDPAATETYSWLDHEILFHRCRTCGGVTHGELAGPPRRIFALNARMMVGLDGTKVRVHRKDNGHQGWFWTRPDGPVEASRHPPPEPGDWR